MKIKKQNIFEKFHLVDKFDSNKFKTSLFNGKILIPHGFLSLLSLINEVEQYFLNFFNISINEFVKDNSIFLEEKEIIQFQKSIKKSKLLHNKFIIFLKDLNFDIDDTYCDQMTIRFSPSIKERARGLLKPVKPHRDTWASNFQHQINWWIPLHDLSITNSIFFIPKYFTKKVKNNSKEWNFESFKKGYINTSTPVSIQNFNLFDLDVYELTENITSEGLEFNTRVYANLSAEIGNSDNVLFLTSSRINTTNYISSNMAEEESKRLRELILDDFCEKLIDNA